MQRKNPFWENSIKDILVFIILIIVIVGGIYYKITLTDSGFGLLVAMVGWLLLVNWGGLEAYLKFNNDEYYPITVKGVFAYICGAVLAAFGLLFLYTLSS